MSEGRHRRPWRCKIADRDGKSWTDLGLRAGAEDGAEDKRRERKKNEPSRHNSGIGRGRAKFRRKLKVANEELQVLN
jgi:hypothetical protein